MAKLHREKAITEGDIQEISGFIDKSVIDDWLQVAWSRSFDQSQCFVKKVIADGFAASQLLSQLHDTVISSDKLDDSKKAKLAEKMSICDKRLMDGADEYLTLMDITCEMMKHSAE